MAGNTSFPLNSLVNLLYFVGGSTRLSCGGTKKSLVLLQCTFKKKAPKATKEIRRFAEKAMGTKDVRVDVNLNKHIWSRGIRSVPRRIRVRIARKINDDEDAKEELYSLVTVAEIPAEGLKGLGTKVIDDE
ncbi:60S ribosomal protein L31 [Hibiscus syriacus]|uniref:60S ribosomal protein L31 n=1 Tax=Hibiscus syriacus TaxID=106335 RepID=A0A6A3BB07_HIBSY|nr:60S ribosomal protein L31 [Hibiscus syriacus]